MGSWMEDGVTLGYSQVGVGYATGYCPSITLPYHGTLHQRYSARHINSRPRPILQVNARMSVMRAERVQHALNLTRFL